MFHFLQLINYCAEKNVCQIERKTVIVFVMTVSPVFCVIIVSFAVVIMLMVALFFRTGFLFNVDQQGSRSKTY